MIRAALFDMDGVLYDSMPAHVRAWSEVAAAHQLDYKPEDFYLLEGCTGDYTINLLFRRTYGHEAPDDVRKQLYKEKAEHFAACNQGVVMPGVCKVLDLLKQNDIDRLVVTGSGQHSLIDKLEKDFPGHFSRRRMVTAFDVVNGKPHPEPYLKGLEKAGVAAEEAFVVENAPMGLRSAKAAGIFTIAVNTGPLPDQCLLEAGADRLFHNMDELAAALSLKL
ncbi:MAG: HAD-IA family hydrolase [Tannerella sp.]|jgi:HAD superfamily hydrolase (TIGR01509 family)|nr:HAD-IA family hydrolase [Tannerella sp.]